jgi:hypothetical protein
LQSGGSEDKICARESENKITTTVTWQGLENASIHVGLVLMVAYAVYISDYGFGRRAPEERGLLRVMG